MNDDPSTKRQLFLMRRFVFIFMIVLLVSLIGYALATWFVTHTLWVFLFLLVPTALPVWCLVTIIQWKRRNSKEKIS